MTVERRPTTINHQPSTINLAPCDRLSPISERERTDLVERHSSAPVARRRPNRKRMRGRQLAGAIIFGFFLLAFLFAQVGLYAKVSESGYERADLVDKVKDLKAENALLQAKLEHLRSPEQLCKTAKLEGMVVADSYERVVLPTSVKMAKADR